jgi:hypothetical protein
MAKETYTTVLMALLQRIATLEGKIDIHIPRIDNHLGNIDQHLNKLNERTDKNERAIDGLVANNRLDISINRERITSNRDIIFKLGIPVAIAVITAAIAFILHYLGYIPF